MLPTHGFAAFSKHKDQADILRDKPVAQGILALVNPQDEKKQLDAFAQQIGRLFPGARSCFFMALTSPMLDGIDNKHNQETMLVNAVTLRLPFLKIDNGNITKVEE